MIAQAVLQSMALQWQCQVHVGIDATPRLSVKSGMSSNEARKRVEIMGQQFLAN